MAGLVSIGAKIMPSQRLILGVIAAKAAIQ
jgi:hypothetical protein